MIGVDCSVCRVWESWVKCVHAHRAAWLQPSSQLCGSTWNPACPAPVGHAASFSKDLSAALLWVWAAGHYEAPVTAMCKMIFPEDSAYWFWFCRNCFCNVAFVINMCQSLKQRLGKSNIQARLGRPVGALMRGGPPGGRGGMRGMNRGGLRGRGRGGIMRGALSLRGMYQQTSVSAWILMASFKLCTYWKWFAGDCRWWNTFGRRDPGSYLSSQRPCKRLPMSAQGAIDWHVA